MILASVAASFHFTETRIALACSVTAPYVRIDADSDALLYINVPQRPGAPSTYDRGRVWDVTVKLQPGNMAFCGRDVNGAVPIKHFEVPMPKVVASGILSNAGNAVNIAMAFPTVRVNVTDVFLFCQEAAASCC